MFSRFDLAERSVVVDLTAVEDEGLQVPGQAIISILESLQLINEVRTRMTSGIFCLNGRIGHVRQ